jgi:hypothetical protein
MKNLTKTTPFVGLRRLLAIMFHTTPRRSKHWEPPKYRNKMDERDVDDRRDMSWYPRFPVLPTGNQQKYCNNVEWVI